MIKLKHVGYSLVAITLAVAVSILTQAYISRVYAASTITGNDNQIISIKTTDGLPINGTYRPWDYSKNGNIILFTSSATNLPNTPTSLSGLYIYNIEQDITQRIDVSTAGIPADAAPTANVGGIPYRLSETGRYVTFPSSATNLIDGTTSQASIYIRDTQFGTTKRISSAPVLSTSGANADYNLGISNDGRLSLIASRYIRGSYPNPYKLVLGDGINGSSYSWTALATAANDVSGSWYSEMKNGDISCDGSFITYRDSDTTVKIIDVRRGTNTITTVGSGSSTSPMISCNGRYVLYATTNRTDITPTPTGMNAYLQLVRYDRITGERMYISSNSSSIFDTRQIPASGQSGPARDAFSASIADTGDVVFQYGSYSTTYLKHLSDGSGTLEPIAKNTSGVAVNMATGKITDDGRYIFFEANPYDLGLAPAPSTSQIFRVKTNL